jgi:hypothetical protein
MASSFGNRILTTTQDELLPRVVDTILNSNVLATRMLRAAKKWRGEQLKKPIKVSKNSTGTSFSGFDTFSTSATNNRQRLIFDPKFYQITVALPLSELSVNAVNATKVVDLMSVEMEGSAHDMADDIGTLFYADGTGNSSKDFLGLAAIVDDGTNAATYGELTRASFDTIDSTVTASGGTLTLLKMSTLYSAVRSGSQKPTVGYSDETVWDLYEQLLQPQERITKGVGLSKGLKGGTGFVALDFKGFPILADEKATAQTLFFINEDYLDWYALPVAQTEPVRFKTVMEGNDYGQPMGLGFSWSGWIKPSNSATVIGHIYLGGNLVSFNPKRHGKLTGVTGV